MDSYIGQQDEIESKKVGQNFCSILWAGVQEHDMPQLYYYYNDCQNRLQTLPPDKQAVEEMMMNVSKRLVGMMQMTSFLAGKTTVEGYQTQTFHSARQITIVRQVFPYHIVISVNRPCSERSVVRLLDYVTALTFSGFDPAETQPFVPHKKQAMIPPHPSTGFDDCKQLLNGLLIRYFEDELSREYLDFFQPLLLPRDVVTPHIFALQQIKALQKQHPGCAAIVQKNGRMLLSTAGPFMTNIAALFVNCLGEVFNRRIHWVFGNYFQADQPVNQLEKFSGNEMVKSFTTIYLSAFQYQQMAIVLISPQPTNLKQNAFQTQLQLLNDKLQFQGPTPPVLTKLQDQVYPIFAPIPGCVDACGVDAARIFRAVRGVQNLQINDGKVDYGAALLDGGLLSYFEQRNVLEVTLTTQQEEAETLRSFTKQGEFYAFGENPTQLGGLLSGGKKQRPLVHAVYRRDPEAGVRTAGACAVGEGDDFAKGVETVWEAVRAYVRVEWG